MPNPRSVRFESATETHLASFVARHPGLSHSSAAALLVEEGLRMDAHPGVLFRDGVAGRRAVLAGGPDVWEVVHAVKSARTAAPDVDANDVLAIVSDETDLTAQQIDVAISYYLAYPDEVDAALDAAGRAEDEAMTSARRRGALLG